MKNRIVTFSAYYEFDSSPRRIETKELEGVVMDKTTVKGDTYYLVAVGITAWLVSPVDISHVECIYGE